MTGNDLKKTDASFVGDSEIKFKKDVQLALTKTVALKKEDLDVVAQELEAQKIAASLEAEERRELIKMRSSWSKIVLWLIFSISVFDIFLIISIGRGWLIYPNGYEIPIFIGESLIKIMILAELIVKFLFNQKSLAKSSAKK